MNLVLIGDSFPPENTSASVQLFDLANELGEQGHTVKILAPCSMLNLKWAIEEYSQFTLVRLQCPKIRDISKMKRAVNEILMPFYMIKNLRKTPMMDNKWDGIIWYSPSIFHGPLVYYLKKRAQCKTYLIIRDIFPNWLKDIQIIGFLPYYFFLMVAKFQYSLADTIGVQTKGNLHYFEQWKEKKKRNLQILPNWLSPQISENKACSIQVNQTTLKGRKIFIYAGNMGLAQDIYILINLAEKFKYNNHVGFLFIGRGSEVMALKKIKDKKKLVNVLFFDEIKHDEIPSLYSQCHIGLVSLNNQHKSHNIPGKFLSYMRSGLPVLAHVNTNNDLIDLIEKNNVGKVCDCKDANIMYELAIKLMENLLKDNTYKERCQNLFAKKFSVKSIASQITKALKL